MKCIQIITHVELFFIALKTLTRMHSFNKHKHKNSGWIIKGIINFIKFENNLYGTLKKTDPDFQKYLTCKIDLRIYTCIYLFV